MRHRFSIAGMMRCVLSISLGIVALRASSDAWAAFILLVTLVILMLSLLGVLYRNGSKRAAWVGFALFGWGYMALTSDLWWDRRADRPELATSMMLDWLYPYLQTDRASLVSSSLLARTLGRAPNARNQFILKKLDEPVSMSFANQTPFEDALRYIKAATTGPRDSGIPIYVDPLSLSKAGTTMVSPVTIDVEGIPLRTTVELMLRQLGLTYEVRDGLLRVVADPVSPENFRRIGNCLWALLAACLGSVAAQSFHNTRRHAIVGSDSGGS